MHNNALFDIKRDVSINLDYAFIISTTKLNFRSLKNLAQLKSSGGPALCSG